MINETTLMIVFSQRSFGRNEAAGIVGGLARLMRLVGEGKIRADKPCNKQNGKWHCNAWDCMKYAKAKYFNPDATFNVMKQE